MSQLESALQAIGDVGKGEISFEYDGHNVTLQVLLPQEEVEAQRFASAVFEDEKDDRISGLSYLDRFKQAIICYAIAQVDNLDLREVEFVTTGKVLENGKEVKLPRHLAVRQIVQKTFSRTAITHMFKKYYELLSQVEEKAEKAVKFEPSDRKTEIERLKARVEELEKEEKEEEDSMQSMVSEQVKSIVESGKLDEKTMPEQPPTPEEQPQSSQTVTPVQQAATAGAEVVAKPTPAPADSVAQPGPRQSIIPNAPPVQAEAPVPSPQEEVEPPGGVVTPPPEDGFENIGSSLVDPDDPEEFQRQVAAENARIARARQEAQKKPRRPPPHVAAKKVADELEHVQKAEVTTAGKVDGIPAYRLGDKQEISEKTREGNPDERPRINPKDVGGGAKNPRFRGPQTP